MIELKKIILIDKSIEESPNVGQITLGLDLNLKALLERRQRLKKEEHLYTHGRAYSYREVMSSIIHDPFAPCLVIDRFCLAEEEVEIELTLRAACKSVAKVVSLPWMTAERWHTPHQKWNFIQELGELVPDNLLVARIEEALQFPGRFLSKSEVLAGSISGLELFMLLQSLASSFPQGFCYVHTLRGEQRVCLYFQKNYLVHCLFYDQLTYALYQGPEALAKFVTYVVESLEQNGAKTPEAAKFCFRFFAQSLLLQQPISSMLIKPEEALIKAVVSVECENNAKSEVDNQYQISRTASNR